MRDLRAQTTVDPAVLNKQLLRLERRGRYEEALCLVSDDWANPAFVPGVSSFSESEAAECLLRFASLIGFHGHNERIAGAQERSRDILTDARECFVSLGDEEMIAACENYLALTYWRKAEFREADAFLDEAFSRDVPPTSDSRLYSHVIRSLVLVSRREHETNVTYCRGVEADFRRFGDALMRASLYANLGISLKDLGQIPEALGCLNLARAFHREARHQIYAATIDNNLALLHNLQRNFVKAHECVDSAIRIYKRLKDRTREGSSLETKAQIYLAEGKVDDAIGSIDRSIRILRKSENSGYLAESMMFRSKALLSAGNFADAVLSLIEAVELTRRQAGEAVARELIDEFESALNLYMAARAPEAPESLDEIELIIPKELLAYTEYRGLWITNTHLENLGLPSGSLAVTVKGKVERGDLVAISNNETGDVICGLFDAEFGIVCLEIPPGGPQLFNEDEITVLGKIVGVCRNGKNADGKMVVEPLPI